ncbi:hypothetical protein TCAL_06027 [Tigriopus californicus]|uniref:Uncharacterized protein n=2 Tax=Tigriopus californicus TaxID=6832 RepID=A0A553P7U4_TIGCA|nr:hypothetical protein TCAL_06027 [Tigriopus californicus]
MVSGAKATDLLSRTFGEMVVFSVKEEFEICARITNKPSDVVGCWYNDKYVISADFKWLSNSHRVSTSLLWLNKITPLWSESAHDYTLSCMRSLFKFYNPNASCVRHFLVCNVPPQIGRKGTHALTQNELLNENLVRQILARESGVLSEQRIRVPREIPSLPREIDDRYISFMRGHTFEIFSDTDISTPGMFEYSSKYREKRLLAHDQDDSWVYEGNDENSDEGDDSDDWEYFDEKEADLAEANKPEYLKIDRGHEVINEKEKLLIFTTGSLVQVPHQVGIKKMSCVRFREHMDLSQSLKNCTEKSGRNQRALRPGHEPLDEPDTVDWSDYPKVSHMFDHIDVILDFPGRVVGLATSPDSRFLYVSYRAWPKDFVIKSHRDNPPLASEAFCSVMDLETFDEVGTLHTPVHCFTSNSRVKAMGNPDVGRDLIAVPLGTEHAGLFDRFYGVQLGEFSHSDVINHVSLEPTRGQMAVSVGDDMKVQLWKSREMMAQKRRRMGKPQI